MSFFITFEGIEGCGKTTQIEMLTKSLKEKGLPVMATREPGGTKIGDSLRGILLKQEGDKLFPLAELLLYLSARAQLVEEVIRPALEKGKIVICDRFLDSTMAYQGFGRGMDLKVIDKLNTIATDGIKPDITFILDCSIELGLERAWERIGSAKEDMAQENRFEMEDISFHKKIREGYLELAATAERFIIIQGDRDKTLIHKEICGIVNSYLTKMGFC